MISTSTKPWLVCPQPNPYADVRLFCLPYAGGGASMFRTWPNNLPVSVEVVPVHLPGRETRINEQPFKRLQPLVEAMADAVGPQLSKPYAIFGHSMGALLGFELARRLRREGLPLPLHIFVSARAAPQHFDRGTPTYALPEPDFVEEVRRLNGTPPGVLDHQELRKLMLPVLRSDFELLQTYRYPHEPKLDCPISAFGGEQDYGLNRGHLEGWREQTSASFSLDMLPGDHFFLRSSQQLLLDLISHKMNLRGCVSRSYRRVGSL